MDSANVDDRVLRQREANRKWKAANPDKVRAQARLDHARKVAADPEYNKRTNAARKARDPDAFRAARAASRKRHRDKVRNENAANANVV